MRAASGWLATQIAFSLQGARATLDTAATCHGAWVPGAPWSPQAVPASVLVLAGPRVAGSELLRGQGLAGVLRRHREVPVSAPLPAAAPPAAVAPVGPRGPLAVSAPSRASAQKAEAVSLVVRMIQASLRDHRRPAARPTKFIAVQLHISVAIAEAYTATTIEPVPPVPKRAVDHRAASGGAPAEVALLLGGQACVGVDPHGGRL
mmetsp:Transcript_49969/g.143006  ORF Transcript_49969/g.143006 Transcript_49969/m.143006 type:complete len:205 (-) Transcript_49969:161-775(-)